MQAGFARIDITPPKGTPLMGWGSPSVRHSTGANDPLFVRALSLSHGGEEVFILAFDLCFVAREDAERWHGMLAREMGLQPRQVMFTATHTHAAPAVGNYMDLMWLPVHNYKRQLDVAILDAITLSRKHRRPARLRAARGKTTLPMNRRKNHNGRIVNGPNPPGPVYDALPVCLFEDEAGKPVCLLFGASTHAVCYRGRDEVSADYPGAAMLRLNEHLKSTCSMFVQGVAGDSRPGTLARGEVWAAGPGPAETTQAGRLLAEETLEAMKHLREVEPALACAITTAHFPLANNITREQYYAIVNGPDANRGRWANDQLCLLDRNVLPTDAAILFHGVQLGKDVRMIAVEGEPLHHFGPIIEGRFASGMTVPIGYTNGEGMYLPSTEMIAEGGYEVESFWEYHKPSPLAPGMESVIESAVERLKAEGVG